jgi:hypothetical protein
MNGPLSIGYASFRHPLPVIQAEEGEMSNFVKISGLALLALFAVSQADARPVHISGTHTRSEIARKCQAVGGQKVNTDGNSGAFGCVNLNKYTSVDCDAQGHCTGKVPD